MLAIPSPAKRGRAREGAWPQQKTPPHISAAASDSRTSPSYAAFATVSRVCDNNCTADAVFEIGM